ncbi:MAG: hypothetical protein J0H64_00085 [Actinobacteria bacterium]|nr:hypothetical protein [Actinomycetota bacterium]
MIWSSGTAGNSGASFVAQDDGNLVIYSSQGAAKWSSQTNPASETVLTMQNDGNLVLYSRGGLPLWASMGGKTGIKQDSLPAGAVLSVGKSLYSQDGKYFAVMQADGNFVKYSSLAGAQWASNTSGSGANAVTMQGDGNLVVYAGSAPKWSSGTTGRQNAALVLQNDGNLVVYSDNSPIWASNNSNVPPSASGIGGFKAWALNPTSWKSSTDGGKPGIDADGWYGAQCADLGIAWSQQSGRRVGFDGLDASSAKKTGWHYVSGTLGSALPGDVITRVGGRQHVVVVTGQPANGVVEVIEQNPGSPAVKFYSTSAGGTIWRLN